MIRQQQLRHGAPVSRVRFHPRGHLLLSAGWLASTCCLWSILPEAPPALLARFGTRKENKSVLDIDFVANGAQVAVVGQQQPLEFWQVCQPNTDQPLPTPQRLRSHRRRLPSLTSGRRDGCALCASPTGRHLLLCHGESSGMELVGVTRGQVLQTLTSAGHCVALHPEGELLAWVIPVQPGSLIQFGVFSEREDFAAVRELPLRIMVPHLVTGLAFGLDGQSLCLVGGLAGERVEVWDLPACTQRFASNTPLPPEILLLVPWNSLRAVSPVLPDGALVAPDGRMLLHGTAGGNLVLQPLRADRRSASVSGHDCVVTSLAAHRDTQRLATGALDGTITLWSWHDLGQPLTPRHPAGMSMAAAFDQLHQELMRKHEDHYEAYVYTRAARDRSWEATGN